MPLTKTEYIENLRALLKREGLEESDIYKRTSIGRSRLRSILDPGSNIYPDLMQSIELTELLNTTLYYMAYKQGPSYVTLKQAARLINIMSAYQDMKNPDKPLIIRQIVELEDYETIVLVRETIDALIAARADLTEDKAILKCLVHAPEALGSNGLS